MIKHLSRLIFLPKCLLCEKPLARQETDLCRQCRMDLQEYPRSKKRISFIAQWTAMWYYSGNVRSSIHRYKFYHRRSYAQVYGRLMAVQLLNMGWTDFDFLTWVPISAIRKHSRGYDQGELLCKAVARELGLPCLSTLKKIRHNDAQSSIQGVAQRRANVLGIYRVKRPDCVAGKRILLLDDIITTGATASECARTLLTAGAKEVYCAAIAATDKG